MRRLLDEGRFQTLFRDHLLWDNPPDYLHRQDLEAMSAAPEVPVIGQCVAEKRGVMAWSIVLPEIPSRAEQHRKARELRQWSSDQLVVFAAPTEQLWLWPEQRPSGTGWRLVDHHYRTGEGNDALLQRLDRVRFEIKEKLTGPQVLERVRQSFNVDKVTKRFYTEFKKQHQALTDQIEGIPAHRDRDRRWYASVLMNRLMFIYFIQRKGFLGQDPDYLRNRLNQIRDISGGRDLNAYFGDLLLPLFHEGLGKHPSLQTWDDPDICRIVGQVPYVDGGIFERHDLERDYEMEIPDSAFESLFDFFDQWRWHLDERPSGEHNEINPDILGFIFEQYVNYTEKGQKEKGAYYTKPDVTGYMSVSTIIPAVVDRLVDRGLPDPCVLLPNSGDRYLHSVLGYGREVDLPDGDLGPSEFPDPALDIALPGERWCDVTHRRDRYNELVALVGGGGVDNINDAVTANLDLAGLMEDYLSQMPAHECEIAFEVLRSLTVCDPTCGSGAFLLSALDVLQPMYTVVLDRAREIADSVASGPGGWSDVPQFLAEAANHPNDRYWLLKTICLNNLYGVDLMGEAAEIAKLRLFLKLVAQLDDVEQVEPLPDLDFNIKSGNLLVGIADMDDADRRFSDDLLQLLGIKAAEQAAKKAADAYELFVKEQIADSGTGAVAGKQRLVAQIRAATTQADVALYEMRGEKAGFESWMSSHNPFHWFAEFPSVWRNGGFDVIAGNPPYINPKNVREYVWMGNYIRECPNGLAGPFGRG
ncbi:MAG: SAM-dependent methyltransferase, partial [bacterium]|nr:SAM-dependent methyltransferase [bacterium]